MKICQSNSCKIKHEHNCEALSHAGLYCYDARYYSFEDDNDRDPNYDSYYRSGWLDDCIYYNEEWI
jgi:hypothetical protein